MDGVAVDDAAEAGTSTIFSRVGERVAVLEAKTDALKEDTGRIRASIHDINNELMKVTYAEQNCANNLSIMATQMSALGQQVAALATAVADLVALRNRGEGAWATLFRLGSIIVGTCVMAGAIATVIMALLGKLTIHP
jgi:prefoldin subunit 5